MAGVTDASPQRQHSECNAEQDQNGKQTQDEKQQKQQEPGKPNEHDVLAQKAREWAMAKSQEAAACQQQQASTLTYTAPFVQFQGSAPMPVWSVPASGHFPPPQHFDQQMPPVIFLGAPLLADYQPAFASPACPNMAAPDVNLTKKTIPSWLKDELKKAVVPRIGAAATAEVTPVDTVLPSSESGDEEEEEDELERDKALALNAETKRVVTEVLLKVTESLFNEIAQEVIAEEADAVDEDGVADGGVPQQSTLAPSVPTRPSTPRVLLSKLNCHALAGGSLGLASYGSDDELEDDDNRASKDDTSLRKGHDDTAQQGQGHTSLGERGDRQHADAPDEEKRRTSQRKPDLKTEHEDYRDRDKENNGDYRRHGKHRKRSRHHSRSRSRSRSPSASKKRHSRSRRRSRSPKHRKRRSWSSSRSRSRSPGRRHRRR